MFIFRWIKSAVGKLLSLLNSLRKIILNGIFYLLLIMVVVAISQSDQEIIVKDNSALLLNLSGNIVEQKQQTSPMDAFADELAADNDKVAETLLADVVKVINHAKTDPKINTLVLKLVNVQRAGLTKMRIIAKAIEDFKTSGKQVIAIGDHYNQDQYYLASYADEIWLNPNGWLMLDGYGRYQMYFKSAFEKLALSQHIFRVGTYKSAVEPYMRDDMSDEAKEANQLWLDDLWSIYKTDVAKQRGFAIDNFDETAPALLKKLTKAQGKIATYALENNWVDSLKSREEMHLALKEIVGKNKKDSFNRITFNQYLKALPAKLPVKHLKMDKVAIVVAKGTILDGKQPAGKIGGDSTAALLRKARKDDNVKAVVLRVDSPGGSAFASDIIRQEVELLKEAGKPVVASMGSYAASGGYWISAAANKIYASPTTITGSIGIFGFFMTFENTLEKLGIYTDGVGTTDLAGLSPTRPFPKAMGDIFQLAIERGYQDFIELVAANRDMSYQQVDQVAQGRVWSGVQAKTLGLVDELGDLDSAIAAAADIAGLSHYKTMVIEKELSPKEKLLKELLSTASVWLPEGSLPNTTGPLRQLLTELTTQFGTIQELNDPQGIYALCVACQEI